MKKKDINKPVTLKTLGEFTESVLLPAVEKIVDNKLDERLLKEREHTNKKLLETRDYLDKRLSEMEERIIIRISRERKQQKEALIVMAGILRKSKLFSKTDVQKLQILERELAFLS